jgi:hypothetical protein
MYLAIGGGKYRFVSEREIFLGTGSDTFSPNAGMTRASSRRHRRLYERSYGEIKTSDTLPLPTATMGDYYGKYVDWAAETRSSRIRNGRFNRTI